MMTLKSGRWLYEEVEFLKDNYEDLGEELTSEKLDRDRSSIKAKAFKLGLLKKRDTDLIGRKFGRLKVVDKADYKQYEKSVWVCICECGNKVELNSTTLKSGNTSSCGCLKKDMMADKALNLLGKKFGRLTVIEKTDKRKGEKVVWKCRCDCGNYSYVGTDSLTGGNTKSCGCYKRELTSDRAKIDITGERYGRLLCIGPTGGRVKGQIEWLCECVCGKKTTSTVVNLRVGSKKSCGCLVKDNALRISRETRWMVSGRRSWRYNPELTDEERLKNRYQLYGKNMGKWRNAVYKNNDYTCQVCYQVGGKLNAHHMNSWNSSIEGRFDVSNGVTLCEEHHKELHSVYGYGNNTKNQFEEFKAIRQVAK